MILIYHHFERDRHPSNDVLDTYSVFHACYGSHDRCYLIDPLGQTHNTVAPACHYTNSLPVQGLALQRAIWEMYLHRQLLRTITENYSIVRIVHTSNTFISVIKATILEFGHKDIQLHRYAVHRRNVISYCIAVSPTVFPYTIY